MWMEAILLREDLLDLASALAPIRIDLGPGGHLELSDPTEVTLLEGFGLRVTCEATLRWTIVGVSVPVRARGLTFLVQPRVEPREGVPCLVFGLALEKADFARMPAVVDASIVDRVNAALAARDVELAWRFGDTLSHAFELPDVLRPLVTLSFSATDARVKLTERSFGLAISFRGSCVRQELAET